MGSATNRSIYFEKYCRNAATADEYLMALHKSPFKTHRRMAELLLPEVDRLIDERNKQIESERFAKSLEV